MDTKLNFFKLWSLMVRPEIKCTSKHFDPRLKNIPRITLDRSWKSIPDIIITKMEKWSDR